MEPSSSFGKFFYFSYFAVGSYLAKSLLDQVGSLPLHFLYSTVEVQSHDDAYNYLLFWLTKQRFNESKNRLIASTSLSSGLDYFSDDSDDGEFDDMLDAETSTDTEWKASLSNTRQLLWSPSEGIHYFRYGGRCLALTRQIEERGTMLYTRTDKLRISCLGWDASILKQLLLEARVEYSQKEKGKTVIYRGAKRSYDNDFYWARSTARPARPLSTVILDHEEKTAFIQDVQQYLHPSTMRWYSDRGIPYRRGYLFYGPPGTGKSSLAFAAAGFLGLNVYILDLNATQLTEDALAQLFQELPRRCLVLLEDIDTNEVTSRRSDESKKKRKGNNKISLSALLNTIDGVAAQEGRVLVMTTNHQENLDPALIRPGRVDYQIEFKLANRNLMMQMFQNLFRDVLPSIESHLEDSETGVLLLTSTAEKVPLLSAPDHALSRPESPEVDMEQLAATFAEKIPELMFSPAEIQGYLLCHKSSPLDAIAHVESWGKKTLEEKKKKDAERESQEADNDSAKDKARKGKKGKKDKKAKESKDETDEEKEESSSSESESDKESSDEENKEPNGM
ncbi:BCS1 N terminal-domain-containing protein [Aspergillus pseudotamarii]|uniref:BCS1 N terminal-domain-containing protein n=1 Tax=Aspergillus pseudotamarii TaxID=132259 RepID=A0A5N6T015_ASPPS|nr:BCS1 N terminal-domain-containing protein [Aspergillus pseudotamarii]KAE8139389.1 BCS1 N terminal-domain-containing protein [Aspergillus pseudotamarii]